mgnify:FL=1
MPKEILLYSGIYSYVAESFLEKMEAAKEDDIVLRINSDGGDPQAVYGMIAKFAEHKGSKSIKVDGKANSSAAFFLAYADEVEILDVSQIVLHRAAYPSYYEAMSDFKDSDEYNAVVTVNKNLRAGLESKIDIAAFEKTTKVTLDEMFSMDSRIDVSLTPTQAKKIGLISSVKKLTKEMKAEIQSKSVAMAAEFGVDFKELKIIEPIIEANKDKPKTNKMTIEDLKADHSEVYNAVFNLGSTSANAERTDTVNAWLVYNDIDAKAVKAGIESGDKMSQTQMAELVKASFGKEEVKKEVNASVKDVTPDNTKLSGENKEEEQLTAAKAELSALFAKDKI